MGSKVAAYLGLGSNIGDRRATLRTAVNAIVDLAAVSPAYETDPVGGPDQDAFLNIVVKLETSRSPRQLLELCAELETVAGRQRLVHWGPRTLDVDVLLVASPGEGTLDYEEVDGFLIVDEPDLVVPHPRMAVRNFVLRPLLDVAPELDGHVLLQPPLDEVPFGNVEWVGVL